MLGFGVCYHPEQWAPGQAKDHVKLLEKARVNVARMGEAAWCKFEPEQGRFRFEWLDPVIEECRKAGISTVLCTPTAHPPLWVHTRHPHVLRKDAGGNRAAPTSPHSCCVNAPEFQILCDSIVQAMARHYAKVEGVIGWQIDEALATGGTARCYCEHCEKAFRQWLLAKYQTTDALNDAWRTVCGGMEIRQWNEVPLPRAAAGRVPAGLWLDYARFCSDSVVGFVKRQREIIKEHCGPNFVTHNAGGRSGTVDLYKVTAATDFASWRNNPAVGGDPYFTAYLHATTRSLKGTFWVLGQRAGATQVTREGTMGDTPDLGEMRRWAWQAVANGAECVCMDPWRTPLSGGHMLRQGILDVDGVVRRRYKEFLRTGEEFGSVGPQIEGTRVESKVAILRSFEARWSADAHPVAPGFRYDEHVYDLYRAVKRSGHSCDFISTEVDINEKYLVLIAPALRCVDETLAEKLEAYVKNGGTLVLTPQSGSRTMSNGWTPSPLPGLFASLTAVSIEEVVADRGDRAQAVHFARGALIAQQCKVRTWFEVLECHGAEPVAEYLEGRLKGKTAIARRGLGSGQVFYMGVYLPREFIEPFISELLPEYPVTEIPEGVEIVQRKGEKGRFVFVLNHTNARQHLKLPGKFPDLLTGESIGPAVTVSANGILILKAS